MRLSALFAEFCQYLRVEKEAAPRSIETYRWCFGDFAEYARQDVGGTVLVQHFTVDRCRGYQYSLAATYVELRLGRRLTRKEISREIHCTRRASPRITPGAR